MRPNREKQFPSNNKPMKTPNPNYPVRNTLRHLALASTMGAAMYFGASPASAAPSVTADLKLHLDASQITGLSDGATVTIWTDKSGLGNHATAAGTPIYKTGVLNGRPVIRFNDASSLPTGVVARVGKLLVQTS